MNTVKGATSSGPNTLKTKLYSGTTHKNQFMKTKQN